MSSNGSPFSLFLFTRQPKTWDEKFTYLISSTLLRIRSGRRGMNFILSFLGPIK